MLERASTCLESGARVSLQRVRASKHHRRRLHAAFWDHNVGSFDLPALNFDTTLWHSQGDPEEQEKKTWEESAASTGVLDFLYPRQALAWLSRAPLSTHEAWEKRKARRLPNGFIQASRRYSSISAPWGLSEEQSESKDRIQKKRKDQRNEFEHHDMGFSWLEEDETWQKRKERKPSNADAFATQVEDVLSRTKYQPLVTRDPQSESNGPAEMDFDAFEDSGYNFSDKDPMAATLRHVFDAENDSSQSIDSGIASRPSELVIETTQSESITDMAEREYADVTYKPVTTRTYAAANTLLLQRSGARDVMAALLKQGDEQSPVDHLIACATGFSRVLQSMTISYVRSYVDAVWSMFRGLSETDRKSIVVVESMMSFLSTLRDDVSDNHIVELYSDTPTAQRTQTIYGAAASAFLRMQLLGLAHETHVEALQRDIKGARELAAQFVLFEIERKLWYNAFALYKGLGNESDFATAIVRLDFWRGLMKSDIDLIPHATAFSLELRQRSSRKGDQGGNGRSFLQFGLQFCKVAILRDCTSKGPPVLTTEQMEMRSSLFTNIFAMLPTYGPTLLNFLEDALLEILRPESDVSIQKAARFLRRVMKLWLPLAKETESPRREEIFEFYLEKLIASRVAGERDDGAGIQVESLVELWTDTLGEVSIRGLTALAKGYASQGDLSDFTEVSALLRQRLGHDHTSEALGDDLVSIISVFTSLRDPRGAQEAFDQLRIEATKDGKTLDIRYWNALMETYVASEDIDGASRLLGEILTNLQPNKDTVLPLMRYAAVQADLRSIQNLLSIYVEKSGTPLTAELLSTVVQSLLESEHEKQAFSFLTTHVEPLAAADNDLASLTRICNLVLEAFGIRYGPRQSYRIQTWMVAQGIPVDDDTRQLLESIRESHRDEPATIYSSGEKIPRQRAVTMTRHYEVYLKKKLARGDYAKTIRGYEIMKKFGLRQTIDTTHCLARAQLAARPIESAISRRRRLRLVLRNLLQDCVNAFTAGTSQHMEHEDFWKLTEVTALVIRGLASLERVAVLRRYVVQLLTARQCKPSRPPLSVSVALMDISLHHGDQHAFSQAWDRVLSTVASTGLGLRHLTNTTEQARSIAAMTAVSDLLAERTPSFPTWSFTYDGKNEPMTSEQPLMSRVDVGSHEHRLVNTAVHLRARYFLEQGEHGQLLEHLESYQTNFWTMRNSECNDIVIRCLMSEPPLLRLGFYFTEHYLIDGFPGWQNDEQTPARKAFRKDMQYMNSKSLDDTKPFPLFSTMYRLSRAFADKVGELDLLRKRSIFDVEDLKGLDTTEVPIDHSQEKFGRTFRATSLEHREPMFMPSTAMIDLDHDIVVPDAIDDEVELSEQEATIDHDFIQDKSVLARKSEHPRATADDEEFALDDPVLRACTGLPKTIKDIAPRTMAVIDEMHKVLRF